MSSSAVSKRSPGPPLVSPALLLQWPLPPRFALLISSQNNQCACPLLGCIPLVSPARGRSWGRKEEGTSVAGGLQVWEAALTKTLAHSARPTKSKPTATEPVPGEGKGPEKRTYSVRPLLPVYKGGPGVGRGKGPTKGQSSLLCPCSPSSNSLTLCPTPHWTPRGPSPGLWSPDTQGLVGVSP